MVPPRQRSAPRSSRCQADGRKPSIGKPIANTTAYVLDQRFQPAPIGVPGELYLGGIGLARGYLDRPDLTAQRFLPDPFRRRPGSRLYRTGDLCRWLPDGNLEFLGRVDEQVKVRGFRIELGEIESVLSEYPAVRQTVVIAHEDKPGDKRLTAYVVAAEGLDVSIGDYRLFLSSRLPEYMIPSAWVVLNEMPLTPNGKVDRKALPAPEGGTESESTYVAPGTPTEESIAEIWARILKVERVGVQDNFFLLGGHSLLVTQVVSHLREALQVELPLRAIFEAPTVAGLAERVEATRRERPGIQAPPLVPVPRDQPLPLSFAQQRLWFIDQLTPGGVMYNVTGRIRLHGKTDPMVVAKALSELCRRQEVLRTRFPSIDGQPVQFIDPSAAVDLPVSDLRELPAEERRDKARQVMSSQARTAFDLAAGPLVRFHLLLMNDDQATLVYTMHHSITDGWSMGILSQEVSTLYEAYRNGQEPSLPELPIQYADYAVWQKAWLQGESLREQVDFWKSQLQGITTLEFPSDRPRPSVQTFRSASHHFVFPHDLVSQLQDLSRREGVTLFMTLLASLQTLLGRYSGQMDVAVGSPIAGRVRKELEGLIGFFINTLVFRGDLSGDPSFRELLARTREICLGAYAHQHLPFEKLIEELQPGRDLSRHPIFQVVLVLQNFQAAQSTPANPNARSRPKNAEEPAQEGMAELDMSVFLTETTQGLRGVFRYSTDLFDEATIARLVGHWQVLLEQVVDRPDRRLAQLSILSTEEEQQLRVEWNSTQADFPADQRVQQLFEQQVEANPLAIAIVVEGRAWSYRELDRRANQLRGICAIWGLAPRLRLPSVWTAVLTGSQHS